MRKSLIESKLTKDELERYPRQAILDEIGVDGQIKLRNARVLVVGVGGLGLPVIVYLGAAGVSNIGIVDGDVVEKSNLQRQILFQEDDIGVAKVECVKNYLKRCNKNINIDTYNCYLKKENIETILGAFDIVADCTDDIECRYLISEYCEKKGKNVVLGSVLKWAGQVYVFPGGKPCYRCLFEEKKEIVETCSDAGVVGSVCGVIGSIQATEIIKMIIERTEKCMIVYDAFNLSMRKIKLRDAREHSHKEFVRNKHAITEKVIGFELKWIEYLKNPEEYLLVDVRKTTLFNLCKIKESVNVQACQIDSWMPLIDKKIAVVCKRGVSAQKCVLKMRKNNIQAFFIEGGLKSFKEEIDDEFVFF